MTTARDWKPKNLDGSIYYDPRKELAYWASTAKGSMVAVPVETLLAGAAVRECGARTTITSDEDGELPRPVEIQCRLLEGHPHLDPEMHYNGYTHWRAS